MLEILETEITFHGTNGTSGAKILAGQIDITQGGGELGLGFYTGNSYHNARAVAFYKSKEHFDSMSVIILKIPIDDLVFLSICHLERPAAIFFREHIKRHGNQRKFLFEADAVEAPIVGKFIEGGRQYKWESMRTQSLLNGVKVNRREIDDQAGFRYYIIGG